MEPDPPQLPLPQLDPLAEPVFGADSSILIVSIPRGSTHSVAVPIILSNNPIKIEK